MIEHETRTINEFGSRRLTIRFLSAGEPTNGFTVLSVPQARSVRQDADRNLCALEIDLRKDGDDYWPVEQVLHSVRSWNLGLSDEDEAEIRRLFPFPWRRTGDSWADTPVPAGIMCDRCGEHQATRCWFERYSERMPTAYSELRCECCCTKAQLEHAEKEAARIAEQIPELRSKLAAGCGVPQGDGGEDAAAS